MSAALTAEGLQTFYGKSHILHGVSLEAEEGKVALRRLGSQAQEVVTLEEAVSRLTQEATPPDLRSPPP